MPIDAEWIIKTARGIIVTREITPMLFVSHKTEEGQDGVAMIVFNVPTELKHKAMRTVGHVFADKECDAIAMISEAWISKVDMKVNPDIKMENIVPHDDPNRGEALVYVMLAENGEMDFRMYEIERGLDGPVLIEQPKNEDMEFQSFLLQQFWKGWEDKSGSGDEGFEMKRLED